MIAAIAVLALAGGFGRLAALGQVVSGPTLPGAPLGAAVHAAARATAPLVAAASARPGQGVTLLASTGAGGAGAAVGHRQSGRGNTTPGFNSGPGPYVVPGSHPNGPPGSHHPGGHSTPVDTVVGIATSVTSQLPAPAGPAATQALETVGHAVDKVLPPTVAVKTPVSTIHLP
jgi:hypothetical protein